MVKYICEGTCGGSVSEEEFNAGKHVCGTEGCTREGEEFTRVEEEAAEEEK